jgi:glycosidase
VFRFAVWFWCFSAAAAPVITKVEPPSWRLGRSSTVRLLIRGSGLRDADVHGARGLEIIQSRPNDTGSYLFVDVKARRTGSYTLKISTHEGSATAAFQVLEPLPAKGRFQGFSHNDLMYMIVTDRFANGDSSNDDPAVSHGLFDRSKPRFYHGGDFQGIIDHLAYLRDLGVSAIWITPVYDNANTLGADGATGYHGYHPVDFYAVDEHFGTVEKLRELVDKAHQSGIKVILDMVMNHTGPAHPWVKNPPLDDWFHGTPEHHLNETFQIWTLLDPHAGFTLRDPVLDGWFVNELPDLNQDEPEVETYLIQNTLWWIANTGIDGARADAMPYVPRKFWSNWNAAIKKEYPDFTTVGEVFDGDTGVVSFFQGGSKGYDGVDTGMDALFDFPLYEGIRRAFGQGKTVAELPYTTAHDSLYNDSEKLVTFLGNHDVRRFLNEPGATIDGLNLAFAYLFTTRGIPMIYYGDEIAMRGGDDPDNRKDFPGGWNNDITSAFDPAKRTAEERKVFDFVRKLALLRQRTPDLRTGKLTQVGSSRDAYVFTRGSLIVLANNGAAPVKIEAPAAPGTWKDLLDVSVNVAVHERVMTVTVPPQSIMIMQQR